MAKLRIVASVNKLLAEGTLVRCKRPPEYQERRGDGYLEPETVYVLGTNHRSRASAAAARSAVLALKPDVVMLELCRTRQALLVPTDDGDDGRRQAAEVRGGELAFGGGRSDGSYIDSLRTALKSGSVGAVALRLAVARAFDVANGGDRLDSAAAPAGADFRAANQVRTPPPAPRKIADLQRHTSSHQAAEEVGAVVALGDRPIELSMSRFLAGLGLTDKWTLGASLLSLITRGPDPDAAAEARRRVDKVMAGGRGGEGGDDGGGGDGGDGDGGDGDDVLADVAGLLEEQGVVVAPAALAALTSERDSYLAWSLKRSKVVRGTKVVLGVVGRAHLPGVVAALESDRGGDVLSFRELTERPAPPPLAVRVAWEVALWGSTAWLLWPR